jgi:hypothetical protein
MNGKDRQKSRLVRLDRAGFFLVLALPMPHNPTKTTPACCAMTCMAVLLGRERTGVKMRRRFLANTHLKDQPAFLVPPVIPKIDVK